MRSPALVPLLVLALVVATASSTAVAGLGTDTEQPIVDRRQPVTSQQVATDDRPQVATTDDIAYTVRQVNDTTGYLVVDDDDVSTSGYGTSSLDVSTAVVVDATQLHGSYESATLETAFESTTNQTERETLLRQEARRLRARLDSLQTRQQEAIESYNAGTITTEQFLHRLARIDAAADEADARITLVQDDLGTTTGFSFSSSLQTRYTNLQAELIPLQGPVRDRITQSVRGTTNGTHVYYVTGPERVTLSTTTDSTYYREAYLGSERVENGTDTFAQSNSPRISLAYNRAAELYPWAFNNTAPPGRGFGNTSVYRITVTHGHGSLTTYLDGNTTNVYRENQRKRLGEVPTERVSNRTETLQMSVERTHATGPMAVSVYDTNGSGVDATVRVNGVHVGSTGDDGRLWTVTPREQVEVTVTTPANETASVQFTSD
jgi:hypothetical protein